MFSRTHMPYILVTHMRGVSMAVTQNDWHPNIKNFVHHIRERIAEYDTRLIFMPVKRLRDPECIGGLFGYYYHSSKGKSGRIVVAANVPVPTLCHTLAHEYAHFLQWEQGLSCYVNDHYVAYERNAEVVALSLMVKFKLPINMQVRQNQSLLYLTRVKRDYLLS